MAAQNWSPSASARVVIVRHVLALASLQSFVDRQSTAKRFPAGGVTPVHSVTPEVAQRPSMSASGAVESRR